MKAIDYINSLIKERDEYKEKCKKYSETIHFLKNRTDNDTPKNEVEDTVIVQIPENESVNVKIQKELDKVKNELKKLKAEHKELKSKYNNVVCENIELKRIFDEVETTSDSDQLNIK